MLGRGISRGGYLGRWFDYKMSGLYARAIDWEAEEKLRRKRELERQAAGNLRRETEVRCIGRFVPAGPWDADCEKWPENQYTWDLGAGFKGRIMRSAMRWTWCGYVELPEWYPRRTENYDFWNEESYNVDCPLPVRELTYGGTDRDVFGGKDRVGEYGFDHSWGRDLAPLVRPEFGRVAGDGYGPDCHYTTADEAIEEVWLLAEWFVDRILQPDGLGVPLTSWYVNQDGFLAIREQMMRITERRQRVAAEKVAAEARVAAEKAAAEARVAAEKAAAEAKWAADAPKRRLRAVMKLLGQVEDLEKQHTNGATLNSEQLAKVARRAELEKERAELEKAIR